MLYPLKFEPQFKERIWGGNKLNTYCNNPNPNSHLIGECWALSGLLGNESVVSNGFLAGKTLTEVLSIYKSELLGESVYNKYHDQFPLLCKFIDANDKLSIQVHPDDKTALERHASFGKTEMWYVIDAEEDAEIILGFNQKVDKEVYLHHLNNGTLEQILNKVKVKAGDAFYIPAGMVHAIGKGILLAEVQQASDITYRLYDYNRVDASGSTRQLHTAEALDVIDFDAEDSSVVRSEVSQNKVNTLFNSKFFLSNIIHINSSLERSCSLADSFVIYLCIEGKLELFCNDTSFVLNSGEVILLPKSRKSVVLKPEKESSIIEIICDNLNEGDCRK